MKMESSLNSTNKSNILKKKKLLSGRVKVVSDRYKGSVVAWLLFEILVIHTNKFLPASLPVNRFS